MLRPVDIAWIAGFLEGEGSFVARGFAAMVTCSQVQLEPLLRLQALVGGRIFRLTPSSARASQAYRWYVANARARGLMMTLYVFMSPKRRVQIQGALAGWRMRKRLPQYRTHCPQGHAYDEENTMHVMQRGTHRRRVCRACARRGAVRNYHLRQERSKSV